MYSLILGTRVVVVLSEDEAVKELMDKRGSIYSSRPQSYIRDLSTGGLVFGFMVRVALLLHLKPDVDKS